MMVEVVLGSCRLLQGGAMYPFWDAQGSFRRFVFPQQEACRRPSRSVTDSRGCARVAFLHVMNLSWNDRHHSCVPLKHEQIQVVLCTTLYQRRCKNHPLLIVTYNGISDRESWCSFTTAPFQMWICSLYYYTRATCTRPWGSSTLFTAVLTLGPLCQLSCICPHPSS